MTEDTGKIVLGSLVKCRHTGFQGVATAKTISLNKCVRYHVQPKAVIKDGATSMPEAYIIDEPSLDVVGEQAVQQASVKNGPPMEKLARERI